MNQASILSDRFEEALVYAVRQHAGQWRKGGRVPYATHVLGVASIVLDHGGDEDQAIAALLHDVDRYFDAPGGALVSFDPATEELRIVARPMPHVGIAREPTADELQQWVAAGGYQLPDWDSFKKELAGSMDTFAKLEEATQTPGRYYVHDA